MPSISSTSWFTTGETWKRNKLAAGSIILTVQAITSSSHNPKAEWGGWQQVGRMAHLAYSTDTGGD